MSEELKPCPCGQTPTKLCLMDTGQGGKWAIAIGNCCDKWSVEFRTGCNPIDSKECYDIAVGYWNDAPRPDGWISVCERLPCGIWSPNNTHLSEPVLVANSCAIEIATYDRKDEQWYCDEPIKKEWIDKVTHWQPLPERLKKNKRRTYGREKSKRNFRNRH